MRASIRCWIFSLARALESNQRTKPRHHFTSSGRGQTSTLQAFGSLGDALSRVHQAHPISLHWSQISVTVWSMFHYPTYRPNGYAAASLGTSRTICTSGIPLDCRRLRLVAIWPYYPAVWTFPSSATNLRTEHL